MNTSRRRSLALKVALIAAVVTVAAACGGSASQILSTVGGPIDERAATTAGPAANPLTPQDLGQSGGNGTTDTPPSAVRDDLRIVYTGSLQLVVDDLEPALARAKAAVAAVGGYIGASQESNDADRPVATITYRIPASRWEDAIASLRGLATKVVAEQTQAAEVGSQIVDLEARIKNLRASEAALQEIAKGAGKISDLIEVQAQLTEVRGEIEQLDAQRDAAQRPGRLRDAGHHVRPRDRRSPGAGEGMGPVQGRRQRDGNPDRRRPDDRERRDLVRHRLAAGDLLIARHRRRRCGGCSAGSDRGREEATRSPAGTRAPEHPQRRALHRSSGPVCRWTRPSVWRAGAPRPERLPRSLAGQVPGRPSRQRRIFAEGGRAAAEKRVERRSIAGVRQPLGRRRRPPAPPRRPVGSGSRRPGHSDPRTGRARDRAHARGSGPRRRPGTRRRSCRRRSGRS